MVGSKDWLTDWLMAKGTGPAPDQREDTLWISINGASSVIGWGEFIIIIIILQLHPNLITWHRTRWSCCYALSGVGRWPVDRDTVTREQIHYTATDKESIILHVLIDGALNKRKEALSHFWRLPVEKIIPLISIFPNLFRVSPVIDTWPNRIDL